MKEKILKNVDLQDRESRLEEEHLSHHDTVLSLFTWYKTDASLEGSKFWCDFANKRIETKFTFSLI